MPPVGPPVPIHKIFDKFEPNPGYRGERESRRKPPQAREAARPVVEPGFAPIALCGAF